MSVHQARGGLVIVDKPAGMTSHDVVSRVRRLVGTRRVGHAGTLDPMATGVLVLGVEKATRLLTFLVADSKDYDATIRLGISTVTDDAQGEVLHAGSTHATDADIASAVTSLTGPLLQRPSTVSAIKINGQRAYARVRAGEDVEMAARPVTVERFDINAVRRTAHGDIDVIDLDVSVRVSSGTYVRALARDLGQALGTGGHLTALRRTRSGAFDLGMCTPLDEGFSVIPLDHAVANALPPLTVNDDDAANVLHGKRISVSASDAQAVAVMSSGGVALAISAVSGGVLVPHVVFA